MAVLTCFVIQKNRDNLSDVVRESPKEKEWCTFCLIFLPLGKEIYPAHTNLEELILVLVKCYSFAAGKQPVPQSAAEPAVGRPAQSFIMDYSHSLTLLLSSSSSPFFFFSTDHQLGGTADSAERPDRPWPVPPHQCRIRGWIWIYGWCQWVQAA